MPAARRRLGDRGENIAERFLAGRGYSILARNYRCPEGEIDLVCREGQTLAFVEVKTRRGTAFGIPEESVTATKIAHLAAAGQRYLAEHAAEDQEWRIDVVAIQLDPAGRLLEVRLTTSAADW